MYAHDVEVKGQYQNKREKVFFYPTLLRSAYKLICQSEKQMNDIPEKFRYKAKIIKKGLSIGLHGTARTKEYDGAWVGRCEPWKKPESFLNLVQDNPSNRFIMVCSLASKNKTYFDSIKTRALSLPNLVFHDFKSNDEIYDILAKSKVLCVTSDSEGDWPMTVLEAASLGLPVVSLHFDNDMFLQNYNAGYFAKGDELEFSRYFRKLLNQGDDYVEKSANAMKYVKDNYDIDKNIKQLFEAIL